MLCAPVIFRPLLLLTASARLLSGDGSSYRGSSCPCLSHLHRCDLARFRLNVVIFVTELYLQTLRELLLHPFRISWPVNAHLHRRRELPALLHGVEFNATITSEIRLCDRLVRSALQLETAALRAAVESRARRMHRCKYFQMAMSDGR